MVIDERIASYTDRELASLRANVQRLSTSGTVQQKAEAERLTPLIDAELAGRKARAPEKAPRRAPGRKAAQVKPA